MKRKRTTNSIWMRKTRACFEEEGENAGRSMFAGDDAMKTAVVIRPGTPYVSGRRKPADLFSGEEIDRLDERMLSGLGRKELLALKQKCSDSFNWLDSGDCAVDSPEMRKWERRLDRLNEILLSVSAFLLYFNFFQFLFTVIPMRYRVICRGFESDGLQIVHALKQKKN